MNIFRSVLRWIRAILSQNGSKDVVLRSAVPPTPLDM